MDPTTEARKTFRLSDAAAVTLDGLKAKHSTENAAINHVLTKWPKEIKALEDERRRESENYRLLLAERREWEAKQKATQAELDQLKNALGLIGKFLQPAE